MIRIGTEWVKQCALIKGLENATSVPRAFHSYDSILGISTDSRNLKKGDLFVAIKGPTFDGHDYVVKALETGAIAALVDSHFDSQGQVDEGKLIRTQNTISCLGVLARGIREAFVGQVIAVVGSNGKTTTKDIIASVLGVKNRVLKSPASFNNHIGVPQTLFKLIGEEKDVLVLELGTNHPGEIEYLCRICSPEIGVLTNIGEEHIEFFGSIEGVAQEEATLSRFLPESGFLVYDEDCPYSAEISQSTNARSIGVTATENQEAFLHYKCVETDLNGSRFSVSSSNNNKHTAYSISLLGEHQIRNAAMAVAVAYQFAVGPEQVQKAFTDFHTPRMRMEVARFNGISVIQDCYNANPTSTRSALNFLAGLKSDGRKFVVLGQHAEGGKKISQFYSEVILFCMDKKLDGLLFVGVHGVKEGIVSKPDFKRNHWAAINDVVVECQSPDDAFNWLKDKLEPDDVLLLKGSRVAGLEKLASKFQEDFYQPFN